MGDQNEWQTQAFRAKIVSKLENMMRSSQAQMPKSSVEMEEYVFQKAHSKEEYLDLVARVLLSVNDHNNKEKKGPGMVPMGAGGGPMSIGGPMQGQQDPINALTSLAGQGGASMGMMGGMQQHMAGGSRPQMMDGSHMVRGPQHMGMRGPQGAQGPHKLNRQDAFMVTSPQTMPGTVGGSMQAQANMNYTTQGRSMVMQQGQQYVSRDGQMQQVQGMSMQPGGSPMNIISPHSQQSMVSPPGQFRPPGAGVPSPINTQLHTPGQPMSHPSPGPPSTSQEEHEYIKKLESLHKYIEPLRKNILELEKKTDEDSKKNQKKMKNLLDILSNPKKRVPMDVLDKCGQLLQKVAPKLSPSLLPLPPPPPPASKHPLPSGSASNGHMCQPLLDAVAHFASSPALNHSLYRTFGPALEAYMGPPIKAPSPPPKKRKTEKESTDELPDVVQGEIARLGRRFVVYLDLRYHCGSQAHHLVCKLEEPRLPSVPPLMVSVPSTYPRSSPQCDPTDCPGYDSTEFFKNVAQNLQVHISHMPNRFSLTQLLSSWEMSVRKACDPKNPVISQPSPIFCI